MISGAADLVILIKFDWFERELFLLPIFRIHVDANLQQELLEVVIAVTCRVHLKLRL